MLLSHLFESSEDIKKKFKITKTDGLGVGFSEENQKWYGWSHRAVCGFGIGDKIFEPNFGTDSTPYVDHGSNPIKTLEDAKKAAKAFADYVS